MANENAVMNNNENLNEDSFELDDLEALNDKLEIELEAELADLELLKEERDKIGNPDALSKVVIDEVWKQFTNQIGLDVTEESLIQKYDRENPETYDEVATTIMQDKKYRDANNKIREKHGRGILKDEYTGKNLGENDKANLDHTVSRKEIYENTRRKQANIKTEVLANKDENLNATNESLNKSKGAKSVDDYNKNSEQREKDLRKQNEHANKKIDESNMSETDKKNAREKNDKRLQDKLDADPNLMKKVDKKARRAINQEIYKGVAKETAKKAGHDALKVMSIQALSAMLKEIMNALVRYFKSKKKSLTNFMDEMKKAFKNFCSKIRSFIESGAKSVGGTIITEIF